MSDFSTYLQKLESQSAGSTAFMGLESDKHRFVSEHGALAYGDTGGAWISVGDAFGPAPMLHREAFEELAESRGRRIHWFHVGSSFPKSTGRFQLRIGDEAIVESSSVEALLASKPSLREQRRRTRSAGLVLEEVSASELLFGADRHSWEKLCADYQRGRRMPEMDFMVRLEFETAWRHRRFWIARRAGEICAAIHIVPAGRNWAIEDMLRCSDAPNGVVDALILEFLLDVRGEGEPWVSLGLMPLCQGVSFPLRSIGHLGRSFYNFRGLEAFKLKFQPRLEPRYLCSSSPRLVALGDLLTAFSSGHPFLFAAEALHGSKRYSSLRRV